jgi:ribosomal protein S6E (S10)
MLTSIKGENKTKKGERKKVTIRKWSISPSLEVQNHQLF